MNTCDTCQWWLKEPGLDVEELVKQENNPRCRIFHRCMCPTIGVRRLNRENIEREDSALPLWVDGIGVLVTGPKFGCLHWEAKS